MDEHKHVTRRDFIKGASLAALGMAMGVNLEAQNAPEKITQSRVILIRHREAVGVDGAINAAIIGSMLDQALVTLTGKNNPAEVWKSIIRPSDIVGIKSNVWGPLPTPAAVENYLREGCLSAGVSEKNIAIDDRGILGNEVFLKATALINTRPLRTHHWSGVGGLLKNYIMFVPEPWTYHDNSCADLAQLHNLPAVKDKTRLNVLVMLTPLFHGVGAHHFDKTYTWRYNGLLVGFDPVALDAVGLQILVAKRKEFFGEDRPMKPSPHHIAFAESRHHLGFADPNKIELIKLGWEEGILI